MLSAAFNVGRYSDSQKWCWQADLQVSEECEEDTQLWSVAFIITVLKRVRQITAEITADEMPALST